ncbi:hypothetical protein H310_01675 [Aphanomyces invadans]|uniref:Uncharacterized protein n=1 Tax=Aphanomyces invadans TaxID=157072 RepID=A0A024USE6_9STRA|nr:hypothetical protein H310_01675 [Aphanomyces invadans]ETW09279.1 hypothetical protein H310_01675 [Aphanomyces invadans]|eukprot:XP_008863084.1 hypothetical protein H310_01675 [Aphanomyces invadans]
MTEVEPLALLSLHRSNLIRLSNFPPDASRWISEAAAVSWSHGVSSITSKDSVVEIKLGGSPWSPSGEDAVHSRRLMLHILRSLLMQGYGLYCATNMSNTAGSKDVLMFERTEPFTPMMLAISINQHDVLRVIDAPSDVVKRATTCINEHYQGGSVRVSEYTLGCTQFKLWSSPWNSGHTPFGRLIVAQLFAHLHAMGWRLYGSAVMQNTSSEGTMVKDSWYFIYEPVVHVLPAAAPSKGHE